MEQSSGAPRGYRFGVFELDLRSGELRRRGLKVRLRGRPVDILLLLLSRRGELVTRDELRTALWSADTFVDFDHGLNSAMNKLRDALGDAAGRSRYHRDRAAAGIPVRRLRSRCSPTLRRWRSPDGTLPLLPMPAPLGEALIVPDVAPGQLPGPPPTAPTGQDPSLPTSPTALAQRGVGGWWTSPPFLLLLAVLGVTRGGRMVCLAPRRPGHGTGVGSRASCSSCCRSRT